jgi:phage shock protein E
MKSSALLLGVVVWLTASSLPAQTDAAARLPAAPAKPSTIREVTPEEAATLLKANTNIVVLDVRRPDEFAGGHIAGATNLNFYAADFEASLAKLDKSKTYLLHCASGGRSTKCLPELEKLQITNVYHLKAGFIGWQKAGNPVAR